MKNQYFGDNRDLFKYDLICQIIRAGLVEHFMFIPMLTQSNEANRSKAKAGRENKELEIFLDECVRQGEEKRNIKQLESFFGKHGISITIYKKDEHFISRTRQEYFKQIKDKLLPKSLILVDPDIGLKDEDERLTDKHLSYSEVKNLYERMDKSSILMIFQFIPHENRENYFRRISKKLDEKVGNLPVYISDNQIVFLFLTRDKSRREALAKTIGDYKRRYPGLRVGNVR